MKITPLPKNFRNEIHLKLTTHCLLIVLFTHSEIEQKYHNFKTLQGSSRSILCSVVNSQLIKAEIIVRYPFRYLFSWNYYDYKRSKFLESEE